jgi:hypothetical protein
MAHDAESLVKTSTTNLHVKNARGGVVDPAVDYSSAHIVNTRVIVVLDPLGHLRELRSGFRNVSMQKKLKIGRRQQRAIT